MRALRSLSAYGTVLTSLLVLAACGGDAAPDQGENAADPLLARAVNDPLMVDPDLSYRNQANAALTIGFDHALPPMDATSEASRRARDEARLELLEDGPIVDLPDAGTSREGVSLAEFARAAEMAKAGGVPDECADGLTSGFIWAARLEGAAVIMPHGQVGVAAGSESAQCDLRVVRYSTPGLPRDVLEYHYNRARRDDMKVELFAEPEQALRASGEEQQIVVHTRADANGMTAVDLLSWKAPEGAAD